ncbi:IS4 family transposase [Plebeiibacterium marinum]|uniref:IS4 family transposase n=1 Tax=Plebeiibacterium marinum TaxID=2992111 RepID=A0AAE3MI90_9BACT|nr:IS4 family transposase [Plebeiobacterium marinum]MCW3808131.1 IS4 family transposase [Plebeiobacterium marinum]
MHTNTKVDSKNTQLFELFKATTNWHKARIKCLLIIINSMIKFQTVSYVKLAQGFSSSVEHESSLRRVQRFFAEFSFDPLIFTRLIYSLLPDEPPYMLSMDRTNWKFGKTDINILMLSVCYKGVSIPLIWKLLPKRGNSNALERKEVLDTYVQFFGTQNIKAFMADREFIGEEWFENLIRQNIPFYIRIRNNMMVHRHGKTPIKAFWLFNNMKIGYYKHCDKLYYLGKNLVYLSGAKSFNKITGKVEFTIIASFNQYDQALINYKERWQIETMFRAMKSSGFNLEDTHLTDLDRIAKLLAVVSIAFVWAYLAGIDKHENIKPIRVKKHGRRAYSFFKYGLIRMAHALSNPINNNDLDECYKVLSCT